MRLARRMEADYNIWCGESIERRGAAARGCFRRRETPGRYEREQADLPRVVIVGGGFGGVRAAHALRRAPVRVTVIDRNNHHVFQPLLYQVATADLSPADIAAPIRSILRHQKNTEVLMGEVIGVDTQNHLVKTQDRALVYDYL